MQSFRTELENPIVEKDIIDLEKKIRQFREGKIDEEKFRSLRLARGVYGQRQPGVQMVRIKFPFGKITVEQFRRLSDVSDTFSTGKLHLTTRQDVQIHYVSLDKTPELWAELEKDEITIREACGNTVRNVTASALAGVDVDEPFDVSPYAHGIFSYFLRKPFGQDLGRKFKIALSSSEKDTAYTFMHDLGLIPKIQNQNGQEVKGFKVMIGGGLGAQPYPALVAYDFLPEDEVIPLIEAIIRVFDRHGERARRNKARIKYLVHEMGLDAFMKLVADEKPALTHQKVPFDLSQWKDVGPGPDTLPNGATPANEDKFEAWKKSNVIAQKQPGFFAVQVKILLGNLSTKEARAFADIVQQYAANDVRITINQGFVLRYVREHALVHVFNALEALGFAEPGFDSVADITACPGTDTCNLGISNSTATAVELERVIKEEYPDLIYNNDIKIKISGCMNSCGQHGLAHIGFHGSSIKNGEHTLPALQLLLGGGIVGDGIGRFADKIIKVPSKRAPQVLRDLLDDYDRNGNDNELFNVYYDRQGKDYFYQLLKELGNKETVEESDYIDWGNSDRYKQEVGVGECAGVVIDLIQTLLLEAEEKLDWAQEALDQNLAADSMYHSYSALVSGAKAILTAQGIKCNTQTGIIRDFQENFVDTGKIKVEGGFEALALRINKQQASIELAAEYLKEATDFLASLKAFHQHKENNAASV
ncbi:MAG: HEPN domain-containing protein [Flavobacteriales bacterium]|nr:HEPN domain-containing protein [Flavobacteriales bacterium]